MEVPEKIHEKIQELQNIEQNLQVFLQQKQSMQVEENEVSNALLELEKESSDEVYKILSGIMIKSDKNSLISELKEKKSIINKRIEAVAKHDSLLQKKSDELRHEITTSMSQISEKEKKSEKKEKNK